MNRSKDWLEAKKHIDDEFERNSDGEPENFHGPFSHNIISLILRRIGKVEGLKSANDLIHECSLDYFGYRPEPLPVEKETYDQTATV